MREARLTTDDLGPAVPISEQPAELELAFVASVRVVETLPDPGDPEKTPQVNGSAPGVTRTPDLLIRRQLG